MKFKKIITALTLVTCLSVSILSGTTSQAKSVVKAPLKTVGWSKTKNQNKAEYTTAEKLHYSGKTKLYAVFDTNNVFVRYHGNGATESNYDNTLTDTNGFYVEQSVTNFEGGNVKTYNPTKYLENKFIRVEQTTKYDVNKETDISYVQKYSFVGWSESTSGVKHTDTSKYAKEQSTGPDWVSIVKTSMKAGNRIDSNGKFYYDLYAIWDAYPVLTAYDASILDTDVTNTDKIKKAILKNAWGDDVEDGKLTDVKIVDDLSVISKELQQLSSDGSVSVTLSVEDSFGNITYEVINLRKSRTSTIDNHANVRYIDKENYNKTSSDEGALVDESVWYQDAAYVSLITNAFKNLDDETYIDTYVFNQKSIDATQEYIATNGRANYEKDDGLEKYANTILKECKVSE